MNVGSCSERERPWGYLCGGPDSHSIPGRTSCTGSVKLMDLSAPTSQTLRPGLLLSAMFLAVTLPACGSSAAS